MSTDKPIEYLDDLRMLMLVLDAELCHFQAASTRSPERLKHHLYSVAGRLQTAAQLLNGYEPEPAS